MPQNRNKLIDLLIGNLSNAVTHAILEKSIKDQKFIDGYRKEMEVSMNIAMKYRSEITPFKTYLKIEEADSIKIKITNKVNNELNKRIAKGYTGIDLNLVSEIVNKFLKKIKIKE